MKKQCKFIETPVYLRDDLPSDCVLQGPAIIEQMDSTCVIPPGWTALSDQYGNILVERKEKKRGCVKRIDPVTVEIIGNLLLSIAEETGFAIIRSAYSTNIKERRDISTACFDPAGNMVAQAEHVAMHLGSLLGIIHEIYKHYQQHEIAEGDMFIVNDPYNGGGTHLPDITVAAPAFCNGKTDWLGC